jgi:hypothetical protein
MPTRLARIGHFEDEPSAEYDRKDTGIGFSSPCSAGGWAVVRLAHRWDAFGLGDSSCPVMTRSRGHPSAVVSSSRCVEALRVVLRCDQQFVPDTAIST